MKHLIVATVAALAMFIPTLSAASSKLYVADATAVIDISAEGSVEDVKLAGVPGEAARKAYEQQIRAWRFEPVLVDDVAVAARANARLRLVAQEGEEGDISLSMREPVFLDPPGDNAGSGYGGSEGFRLLERRVPRYPSTSLQNGTQADIVFLVEIAADGSIRRAGVDSATLLGRSANTFGATGAVRPLIEAARRSVLQWRFETSEQAERHVLIPILFFLHGSEGTWRSAQPLEDARDEWVQAFHVDTDGSSSQVGEFQPDRSTRFALRDPSEQPWL